jgi:hypothetical protein
MELIGDVGNVESHLFLLGESVIVGARLVHSLMHPMVLLGDKAQVKADFGPFGDCANVDAR